MRALALALLLTGMAAPGAWASRSIPTAQDPALEERLFSLASELRCLVCQNQTLADSDAALAADLRQEMREQMQAGASDDQVVQFLVARYGEFVLYRPPFEPMTLLLWLGPALGVAIATGIVVKSVRRRTRWSPPEPLSVEERARLGSLLGPSRPEEGDRGDEAG